MADDIYGANQQESNENGNNESYSNQDQHYQSGQNFQPEQVGQNGQPQQPQQPQQEHQPEPQFQAQAENNAKPAQNTQTYSPAPEFGAYGPVNNAAQAASSNQSHEDAENETYAGQQNPYNNPSNQNGNFGNPYEYEEDARFTEDSTDAEDAEDAEYPDNEINTQPQKRPTNQPVKHANPHADRSAAKRNAKQNAQRQAKRNTQANSTFSPVVIAIFSASISAIVCVVVLTFAVSQGLIALPQEGSLSGIGSNTSGPGTAIIKGGSAPDWKNVAKNVSGAVVSIQTRLDKGMGKGSGVIIDPKGYVVTNNHVIAGANQIQVTLSNGQMYSATLVGADKTTDLAVLKLDNPPSNLKTAQFANSDLLAVGEPVMAIGNPLGYDDTATTGIVSALNRPVSVMDDQSRSEIVTNAVQIDAAINPGNSGGPTFNAAGQIIGINSSIAATSTQSGTAGSIGIGFAIPANLVKRVVSEIIQKGSVKHVALGIMIKSVAVESNGITRGGAQVVSVNQGTPAAKAGLQAGDTIVAFDDKPVTNNYALLGYVRATAFNEKATLTVVRAGNTLKLTVTFNQEEATVTGANRKEKKSNKNQNPRSLRKRGNKSNDDDDYDLQQRGDDDGDDGGIFDPFGFW